MIDITKLQATPTGYQKMTGGAVGTTADKDWGSWYYDPEQGMSTIWNPVYGQQERADVRRYYDVRPNMTSRQFAKAPWEQNRLISIPWDPPGNPPPTPPDPPPPIPGPPMPPCLVGTTPIKTPGGQIDIKKLKVGDIVNTHLGEGKVERITTHQVDTVTAITLENRAIILSSQWHPFAVKGKTIDLIDEKQFIQAKELQVGDVLLSPKKDQAITEIEEINHGHKVYNLTVIPGHTYISNGVYSHNKTPPEPPYLPPYWGGFQRLLSEYEQSPEAGTMYGGATGMDLYHQLAAENPEWVVQGPGDAGFQQWWGQTPTPPPDPDPPIPPPPDPIIPPAPIDKITTPSPDPLPPVPPWELEPYPDPLIPPDDFMPESMYQVNMPPQWEIAGNVLGTMAKGLPTMIPEPLEKARGILEGVAETGLQSQADLTGFKQAQRMAETGMPVDIPEAWRVGQQRAQLAAETGLPTQAPAEWQEALSRARETGEPIAQPGQWGEAEELARQMGQTGFETDAPGQYRMASEFLAPMMQTGQPISQDPWYEQAKKVAEMDIEDAIKQAAEQAGLTGLRYSSVLGRTAADIGSRRAAELGTEWAERGTKALEAARGRQMQSAGMLADIGTQAAQLKEAAAGRRSDAIGMIAGMGDRVADLEKFARQEKMQGTEQIANIGSRISELKEMSKTRQMQALPELERIGADIAQLSEAARQRQVMGIEQVQEYGRRQEALRESAAARRMGAVGGLTGIGQTIAGLSESAKDRGLTAAQALIPWGEATMRTPMDISQQAFNMGLQEQQLQQQNLDRMYQEWMRTQPANDPWMQWAMSAAGLPIPQATPTQYQPSTISELMSLAGMLGSAAIMKSSESFKKDIDTVTDSDEKAIADKLLKTDLFKYRYKFENGTAKHMGLITQHSPDEVTMFDNNMVGLYEYVGGLHATIKELNRRLKSLEDNNGDIPVTV